MLSKKILGLRYGKENNYESNDGLDAYNYILVIAEIDFQQMKSKTRDPNI